MLKLFVEPEPAPRAFAGLCRFLDLLDQRTVSGDPTPDAAGLGFQLKLLAAVGLSAAPRLLRIVRCPRRRWRGSRRRPAGPSARAAWAVPAGFRLGAGSLAALEGLLERPLAQAELTRGRHGDALRVVETTYEHHGGFRLRTLQPR